MISTVEYIPIFAIVFFMVLDFNLKGSCRDDNSLLLFS